jgi:RNA polymerase sigma factor (sigma-70 family)
MKSWPDEQTLWSQFCSGDEEALVVLFKRYYRKLVHYGLKFTPNQPLIEDAIQDLIIYLWLHRHRLSPTPSPTFYVLKAFRHQLFRALKPYAGEDELALDDDQMPFEFSTEISLIESEMAQHTQAKVKLMLDQLPARQKEVVYLRYFQGLRPEEIANLLAIKPQSVSNILQRALLSLRQHWPLIPITMLILGG